MELQKKEEEEERRKKSFEIACISRTSPDSGQYAT
jgi:hypothetical protein